MNTFAGVLQKYIGKPFEVGGHGPFGYDCIHLVHAVAKDLGFEFPDSYVGWTLANCHELYQRSTIAAQAVLVRFFKSLQQPVRVGKMLAGDVLLFYQPQARKTGTRAKIFPAVYVGNNMAVAAFMKKGVCVFELNRENRPIMARRLKKCHLR